MRPDDLSDLSSTMELALTSSSTRFLDTDSSSLSGTSESEASDNEDYLLDYRSVHHDDPSSSSTAAILEAADSKPKSGDMKLKRDSFIQDTKGRNLVVGIASLLIGFVLLMILVLCFRFSNPQVHFGAHGASSSNSSS
ncbi:hypothetical protein M3Y99_01782200 [Aphelenchoides fujianensis]|nr:hypothetical protein M3Y99_01782200 [Aphelenchoides fujianensis]